MNRDNLTGIVRPTIFVESNRRFLLTLTVAPPCFLLIAFSFGSVPGERICGHLVSTALQKALLLFDRELLVRIVVTNFIIDAVDFILAFVGIRIIDSLLIDPLSV